MTCTYCRALDHSTEECPQIVVKWQAIGNPNQNLNLNVKMISIERRNEGPKVASIARGGARTRTDMTNPRKQTR